MVAETSLRINLRETERVFDGQLQPQAEQVEFVGEEGKIQVREDSISVVGGRGVEERKEEIAGQIL